MDFLSGNHLYSDRHILEVALSASSRYHHFAHLYLLVFAEGKDIIFFVSFDRDLEEMSLIVILTHIEVMGTLGKVLEGELPLRIGLYRFLLTYQLHGSPRERRSA